MIKENNSILDNLKPGDHLCCLYNTEEEHQRVLTSFILDGLKKGEKVFYIVDFHSIDRIKEYIKDEGFDPEPYISKGQLVFLTRDESYLKEGIFDPDRMISILESETEKALVEGYPSLRVTGEMTWALKNLPGSERLIEYESKLNDFFPGSKCLAICQYNLEQFSPDVIIEVVNTHPYVIKGTEIYDNFYFIPPREYFSEDLPAVILKHRLDQLKEKKKAQEILKNQTKELKERIQELNCLLEISKLLVDMERPVDEILQDVIKVIPLGWQYPDVTGVRIIFEDKEFKTENFHETPWKQVATIKASRKKEGIIEVCYLEEKPEIFEGPFLKEERDLIEAISRDLTRFIVRKRYELELERSNRDLQQFAFIASHDLQQPLRTISGFLHLLKEKLLKESQFDDKTEKYIDRSMSSANHLQELIQDLLDYSRIDTKGTDFTDVDCSNVINHVLLDLKSEIDETNATIIYDQLPIVKGDKYQLIQLFQNLIGNGIKFRREKQVEIRVSCEEKGQHSLFAVQDNGIGIKPENYEKIFAIFQRLHSREQYQGTGIGLAICKRIIEHHGGNIWVESEYGKGSTFYFTIPASSS
ncbi:MAG: MEDS domain-containing protein [Candidatus Odinarchaeota archaeon]